MQQLPGKLSSQGVHWSSQWAKCEIYMCFIAWFHILKIIISHLPFNKLSMCMSSEKLSIKFLFIKQGGDE